MIPYRSDVLAGRGLQVFVLWLILLGTNACKTPAPSPTAECGCDTQIADAKGVEPDTSSEPEAGHDATDGKLDDEPQGWGACHQGLSLRSYMLHERMPTPTPNGTSTWAEIMSALPVGVSLSTLESVNEQINEGCALVPPNFEGPLSDLDEVDGAKGCFVGLPVAVAGSVPPRVAFVQEGCIASAAFGESGPLPVAAREIADIWWKSSVKYTNRSAWIGTGGDAHVVYIATVPKGLSSVQRYVLGSLPSDGGCPQLELLPPINGKALIPLAMAPQVETGQAAGALEPIVGAGLLLRLRYPAKGSSGVVQWGPQKLRRLERHQGEWSYGPEIEAPQVGIIHDAWVEGGTIGMFGTCDPPGRPGLGTLCRLRIVSSTIDVVTTWPLPEGFSAPTAAAYDRDRGIIWTWHTSPPGLARWKDGIWVALPGLATATFAANYEAHQRFGLSGDPDTLPYTYGGGQMTLEAEASRMHVLGNGDVVMVVYAPKLKGAGPVFGLQVSASGQIRWRRHLTLPVGQELVEGTKERAAIVHGCRVSALDAAGEPISPGAEACTTPKLTACDDGDPCTIDGCGPADTCLHTALPTGTVCGLDPLRACDGGGACALKLP